MTHLSKHSLCVLEFCTRSYGKKKITSVEHSDFLGSAVKEKYYIYDNYRNTFARYSLCNRHYKKFTNIIFLSYTITLIK